MHSYHLNGFPAIPKRRGDPPLCSRTPPHLQLDQLPAPGIAAELLRRSLALQDVRFRQSRMANPDTIALCLLDRIAGGPPEAFIDDHEFCHLQPAPHPTIHLTLAAPDAELVIAARWGELHVMAKAGLISPTILLIYSPRDYEELEVVLDIVRRSLRFACGTGAGSRLIPETMQ